MKKYKYYTLLFILVALLLLTNTVMTNLKESRALSFRNTALTTEEQQDISIFENVKDSVVFISIHQQVIDYWRMSTLDIPKGSGSGFIWDRNGHIVTNYHVIMNANKAIVTLKNGKRYQASLVGVAPSYDIAVLKIQPLKQLLKPLELATSRDLRVGQTVYAVGNPFGLDWTMTKGIISALERSMYATNGIPIKHMIQTDASINPGNSGGPLLNSQGRVIGVNNMILSPSGANAGIGFSIPIDTVKRVVNAIIEKGIYVRPSIGISVDNRLNELYQRYSGMHGVVVADVIPDTSAAKNRLRSTFIDPKGSIIFGDVIISVDAQRTETLEDLYSILDEYKKGDTVILEVLRDNKKKKIEIELQ
ncbi:S1C family serine protease [Sulfurovum sp. ST-21]|uniref:Trypsin-like peptidase domain-containing protein n=1 Tax=Sulfurovum indicum TaxID=2779528 RepID=A0A7M1S0V8_9BACT|nr:trypsin-like peptidase domain-containing protein [Sulfurovum indicum]QOR61016.1 trypsin-like peptidase domain-containing protein [Sulfurovum indicum]